MCASFALRASEKKKPEKKREKIQKKKRRRKINGKKRPKMCEKPRDVCRMEILLYLII